MEHFIMKDDGKLYYVEMPIFPSALNQFDTHDVAHYENTIVKAAIENAVEVSNQIEVKDQISPFGIVVGKIYSLECKVEKKEEIDPYVDPYGSWTKTVVHVTLKKEVDMEHKDLDAMFKKWIENQKDVPEDIQKALNNGGFGEMLGENQPSVREDELEALRKENEQLQQRNKKLAIALSLIIQSHHTSTSRKIAEKALNPKQ